MNHIEQKADCHQHVNEVSSPPTSLSSPRRRGPIFPISGSSKWVPAFAGMTMRWLLGLAVLLLPLLFTLTWLSRNNQLPGNDAANYLLTAVNIQHFFADKGLLRGLFHFYTERGWRPIFFPNVIAPFLILAKGNLFFAYQSVGVLCALLTTLYTYLYFRLRLAPWPAILAASLIGLLPFIQSQILMLYAEAVLFPCVMACLYHLIQSNYCRHLKHTIAFVLWLSLALMLRPVEAVTNLMFVFLLFFATGWRLGHFSIRMFIQVAWYASLAALLFFAVAYFPYRHGVLSLIDNAGPLDTRMAQILKYCLMGVTSATLLLGAIQFRHANHSKHYPQTFVVNAFASVFALTLLWFLPFAANTYEWIYRTSLGDVASSTGTLTGPSFSWDVLAIYLREEGYVAIVGSLLAATAGWFALTWQERKGLLGSAPFLYLLVILPFPFWEAFYTVQVVTRKLSIAFPAILMALLFFALSNGKWLRVRCVVVASIIAAQCALLTCLLFTNTYQQPVAWLTHTIGYFIPQPSSIFPNPHDKVMDFFSEQAAKHSVHSFGLELIPGTPDARHPIEAEPINPFLMSTLLEAKRAGYYAGYPYYGVYSEENVRGVAQRYDAIFLSDSTANMQMTPAAALDYQKKFNDEKSASIKIFYRLMMYYAADQLASIGLKRGPCMVITTQKSGDYLGCLLFSSKS